MSCCKSAAVAVFARYPGTNYIFMEQNAPDDVNFVVITVDVAERSKRSNFITSFPSFDVDLWPEPKQLPFRVSEN